jgi:predicted RNA polymerase sigma factor
MSRGTADRVRRPLAAAARATTLWYSPARAATPRFASSSTAAAALWGSAAVSRIDQDRGLWDTLQIRRGLEALGHARMLGGGAGFFTLQAAIAACHARAQKPEDTDRHGIVSLYNQLSVLTHSPVIELNRAVAVSMVSGPERALEIVTALEDSGSLKNYHLLPNERGDLLHRLGSIGEARAAFTAAAALTANTRERALLKKRAAALENHIP